MSALARRRVGSAHQSEQQGGTALPSDTLTHVRPHVVQFYEDVDELTTSVGTYLARAWAAGECLILITTAERCSVLLSAAGPGPSSAYSSGDPARIIWLDPYATLEELLIDGRLDPARFDAVAGATVRAAAQKGIGVSAFGEMVGLLWESGQVGEAIQLEKLWNDLAAREPVALYCAYPSGSAQGHRCPSDHPDIVGAHSAVVGDGTDVSIGRAESRTFEATLVAPRQVRRLVAETLAAWGGHQADEAVSVVAELAANAVVHAGSSFTVTLTELADGLRISVQDGSTSMPRASGVSGHEPSGRGLDLVARLARRWGAVASDGGKVVWAELDRVSRTGGTAAR